MMLTTRFSSWAFHPWEDTQPGVAPGVTIDTLQN